MVQIVGDGNVASPFLIPDLVIYNVNTMYGRELDYVICKHCISY
jgi:hypothetical protein